MILFVPGKPIPLPTFHSKSVFFPTGQPIIFPEGASISLMRASNTS